MKIICFRLFCVLAILSASAFALADSAVTTKRTITQLADGVYEIRHPDAPDGFPQSNTTMMIGAKGVFVVDSCLLPSSAREDIAQIRKWTNKPVLYLLNTHWHFDHTLGNASYVEAFPQVQIIAQKETQKTIAAFNPGAVARYPQRKERFQKILDSGKDPDGTPLSDADREDYKKAIAGLDPVVAEFKNVVQVVPNVSFDKELNIDLGDREIEIRFLGRGNTAGDAVVYLPKEKILITGDLVDHPVPYFFGGFPKDQVQTLEALAAFNATTIVPGHGDVMHDFNYIHQEIDLLNTVNAAVMKAINDGKNVEADAIEAAKKDLDLEKFKTQFAGDDKDSQNFFDETITGLLKGSFNQQRMR